MGVSVFLVAVLFWSVVYVGSGSVVRGEHNMSSSRVEEIDYPSALASKSMESTGTSCLAASKGLIKILSHVTVVERQLVEGRL